MRKYGYLPAVSLALMIVLTGCGNKNLPAGAGTAGENSAAESSTDENGGNGSSRSENGKEGAGTAENSAAGQTGDGASISGTDAAGSKNDGAGKNTADGPPAPIDAEFTYEYLSEWEDFHEILRGMAPVIRIPADGYGKLQKSLDSYCEERFESIKTDYDAWLPDAKNEYQNNKDNFPGYYLESKAVPERLDEKIFSFRQVEGSYFSGAHPNYFTGGVNFDPADGRELSLEDVVTDREKLYEYSVRYLGETLDLDQLFPDYKESLDRFFHGSQVSPLQWIMDSEGLKLVFSPYDLGPYAMGSIEVPVPYENQDGLIREEYLLKGNGLAKRIPAEEVQEIDLNGDGIKEWLLINVRDSETNGEPDYRSVITVSAGRDEKKLNGTGYQMPGGFTEAYLMRTEDGRSYLYAASSGDNDYSLMDVFDLNGETPVHLGTVNDTPQRHLLSSPGNFTLYTRLDALGTYNGRRRYRVGADGMPEALEAVYRINNGERWERTITSVRPVPVWMEKDGGGEKVRTELPAGTKFCPKKTDGETFVEAELEDGRSCEIRYELSDYRRIIEGVDEWEYFEDLPYAG